MAPPFALVIARATMSQLCLHRLLRWPLQRAYVSSKAVAVWRGSGPLVGDVALMEVFGVWTQYPTLTMVAAEAEHEVR